MHAPAHAASAPAPAPTYGEAELRQAWLRYRLPTWPATFEETMADPIRARVVTLHAAHLAHQAPAPRPAPTDRRHTAPRLPALLAPPPGYVDFKRAAAGDRDD